jgi:uncharacterized protein YcgL (UPF0745 family)
MKCYVYKGDKKEDNYLFLNYEFDSEQIPSEFPAAILLMMGELSLVLEFDLHPDRAMPQADAKQVLADIESKGYYLLLPKKDMKALEDEIFG